jgi:carbon-monoxide dehydrogenase large subunit
MKSSNSPLGASINRLEDPALLTGEAHFVDDIQLPGTLAAVFVRSPYAHAVIEAIDTAPAAALPGVHAVYSIEDLRPYLASESMAIGLPSSSYRLEVNPRVLAAREVTYVGEPVTVVIADSRYLAEDAADMVEIDYRALEAVADCRVALADPRVTVHRELTHNLVATFDFDYGNVDDAFARADRVLQDSFWLHRGGAHSIEGRGLLASYDTVQDCLNVWSSTQRPHAVKRVICDLLTRRDDSVRVLAPHVGGAFGPKLVVYPEEVVVALAALLLGRPVKWIEDRYESFLSSTQERDQFWDVELAFDVTGEIKGIRGALLHDHGAYTARGVNVPYASGITLPLAYNIPAYHLDVYVLLTNKVPVTPVRGSGQPQGVFVMERLMDAVARELGLDRAEIRRRNLVRQAQMPCRRLLLLRGGTEVILDSGDYAATQALALERAGWDTFRRRQDAALARGRYIGIGLANFVEGTGRGPYETVKVEIDASGTILVASGATAIGQGTRTMLAQIVADQLGGDTSRVSVTIGDTAAVSLGFGAFNSRQTVIAGASAHAAAKAVRQKLLKLASHLLEAAEDDLELAGQHVFVKGTPDRGLTLAAAARAAAGLPGFKLPLPTLGPGLAASESVIIDDMVYANGSAVAEVEVDVDTGRVRILRFLLAHDCGRMINPALVDGQVAGGIAHGLGNALFEWMGFDPDAQPVTTTFADYLLISADQMPDVELFHGESPSPLNGLGIKGVGESGVIPTPAVIASAVEDALRPLGITVKQAPLTPAVLWRLINLPSDEPHWRAPQLDDVLFPRELLDA